MCFTVNPGDYSPTFVWHHYRKLGPGMTDQCLLREAGPAPRNAGDWDQGIHFDLVHDDHQDDSLTAQLSLSFTFHNVFGSRL